MSPFPKSGHCAVSWTAPPEGADILLPCLPGPTNQDRTKLFNLLRKMALSTKQAGAQGKRQYLPLRLDSNLKWEGLLGECQHRVSILRKVGHPKASQQFRVVWGDLKEQRLRVPRLVRAVMGFSGPCDSGAERSHIGVSGGMECGRGCQRHMPSSLPALAEF